MNELDWLVGLTLRGVTRREHDWVVHLGPDVSLVIHCLWRLVEEGRIRVTNSDDGQLFGLPAPLVAADALRDRLAGASVASVELRGGTLDLTLSFSTGSSLQVIPESSGYEAWMVFRGATQYIAVGGGDLAIIDGDSATQ